MHFLFEPLNTYLNLIGWHERCSHLSRSLSTYKDQKDTKKTLPDEFASGHELRPSIGHWCRRSAFKVRISDISAIFNLIDRRVGEKVEMEQNLPDDVKFSGGIKIAVSQGFESALAEI